MKFFKFLTLALFLVGLTGCVNSDFYNIATSGGYGRGNLGHDCHSGTGRYLGTHYGTTGGGNYKIDTATHQEYIKDRFGYLHVINVLDEPRYHGSRNADCERDDRGKRQH